MGQESIKENGESGALVATGAARLAAAPPHWLSDLKAYAADLRQERERPRSKPFGRWLGDFLDRDSASGLLPAEEKLLFAVAEGKACALENRAARIWAEFDEWRKNAPFAKPAETGFVAAMTSFVAAAPETVQHVIIEATRYAIEELKLPQYWEPQELSEVEQFATAQRAHLARLESEAKPKEAIERAKASTSFYDFAVAVTIEALTPKPYPPLKLNDESLNGLLRRDPLNVSVETRAKVLAKPRILCEFFDDLVAEVKRSAEPAFLRDLRDDGRVLRPVFDAVFARYERETWRWIDPSDPSLRVRASFLRFLALGGDETIAVSEGGLDLSGAYVGEDLDLTGASIRQPLRFSRCCFSRSIVLDDAAAKTLDLDTCGVRSIRGRSAHIKGAVFIGRGFRCYEGVSFPGAVIEGPLRASGGTCFTANGAALDASAARIAGDVELADGFLGQGGVSFAGAKIGRDFKGAGGAFHNRVEDGSGVALRCDNTEVAGDVFLRKPFRAHGAVSFTGAKIGGVVDCGGGVFSNRAAGGAGDALNLAFATVQESVWLRDGFTAEGKVRLYGAHIKGNVQLSNGHFDNAGLAKQEAGPKSTRRAAAAINLRGAKIDGVLWLAPPVRGPHGHATIIGSLNLSGAHAHEIVDHPGSWPRRKTQADGVKSLPAFIYLDGFVYDRLMGHGDYGPATRKRWLERQPPEHLGVDFRPQPFEQLIKVYREMGHDAHARAIAKFKERRRYRALFSKLWHGWRDRPKLSNRFGANARFLSPLDWLFWPVTFSWRAVSRAFATIPLALAWAFVGFGTAYWYGWGRVLFFLLALWIAGGAFYDEVASQGGFAPSNPAIYLNEKLVAKCGKHWTECKGAPPELPGFSPYIYSLDIMLPVLDLGQKREWQPIDRADHPVELLQPKFTWLPNNDLRHSEIPDFDIKAQPIGEGAADAIVRAQTLLGWGALGLLIAMLSGLIKKD